MFNLIVSPIIEAVKTFMSDRVYRAAQAGARDGLHRFAHDFGQQFEALPAPVAADPVALPMPSAAQTTTADDAPSPALDVPAFERAKEMIANGLSQRETARQLGIPESTLRTWLRRAEPQG